MPKTEQKPILAISPVLSLIYSAWPDLLFLDCTLFFHATWVSHMLFLSRTAWYHMRSVSQSSRVILKLMFSGEDFSCCHHFVLDILHGAFAALRRSHYSPGHLPIFSSSSPLETGMGRESTHCILFSSLLWHLVFYSHSSGYLLK